MTTPADGESTTSTDAPDHAEIAIRATDLGLKSSDGPVYGPVTLEIAAHRLTVLRAEPGSGRTCLLLTLAGRMKPSSGTLTVLGPTRRRKIFGACAVAGFPEIDTLEPAVTVHALLAEQESWMTPWWKPHGRITAERAHELLAPVYGDLEQPDMHTEIGELGEFDVMLLRLALAYREGTSILVVDDLEQLRLSDERLALVRRLDALTERRTVVLGAVDDLPAGSPAHDLVEVAHTRRGIA